MRRLDAILTSPNRLAMSVGRLLRRAAGRRAAKDDMNRIGRLFGLDGEARVEFRDGEFKALSAGDFVRCAVTGQPIPLADLRYWSVELQEAYASAEISFRRRLELRDRKRQR